MLNDSLNFNFIAKGKTNLIQLCKGKLEYCKDNQIHLTNSTKFTLNHLRMRSLSTSFKFFQDS